MKIEIHLNDSAVEAAYIIGFVVILGVFILWAGAL